MSDKSVFRQLLDRAAAAGCTSARFTVSFHDWGNDETFRWEASSTGAVVVPHCAAGRSGEEALRELVRFLEKTKGDA